MRDEDNGFVDLSDWLGAVPDQPEDDVASDTSAGSQSSTPEPEPRPEPAPAPETQPTPHLGDSLSVAPKSSGQPQGSERGPRVSRRAFVIGGIAAYAAIVGAGLASGASEGGAAGGTYEGDATTGTLDDYTWGELSDIASQIAQADSSDAAVEIAEGYGLCRAGGALNGSQAKSFQLADGTWARAQVIGFRHDDRADGSGKAGITFITVDCVAEHAMNDTETNSGGWEASQMRSWMNSELLGQLPEDLRSVLVPVAKMTNNVGATEDPASVTATGDSLWLPSMVEIVGEEELSDTYTESN